jgi:PAS domain S-box-containing protein
MPQRELERLQTVHRFLKLDISKEQELQDILRLAAKICNTPSALITLIDEDTQYILFKQAFNFDTTPRCDAFCDYVIKQSDIMIIPDALTDERFFNNPLVTSTPYIRFYAGAPLTTQDGYNLGSLCVINQLPGNLNELQQEMLQALSRQVIQLMEFDASLQIMKQQFIKARQAEIELRSFFESSIDHHLLLGRNFEILAFNKAWERYVQNSCKCSPQRGESMIEYLSPDNLGIFYKDYIQALKGTAAFGERQISVDGKHVWRLVKFEPSFDNNGEIIGVSVNSTDITKTVEHEQTLLSQNESLREIAFIQSHELRRPVATILGLMNLLEMEGYIDTKEELYLLHQAALELDEKIRLVVSHTSSKPNLQAV